MQGRFNHEALDRRQAEAIFREHLGSLQKRVVDGYITLLEEVMCYAQPEPLFVLCIAIPRTAMCNSVCPYLASTTQCTTRPYLCFLVGGLCLR